MATKRLKNLAGRALGPKGLRTRQRILSETATLLETTLLRDLQVVDIAERCEIASGSFYQYFKDVDHAVLTLAREITESAPPIADLVEESWNGKQGEARVRELVSAYMDHWDAHGAVLRAMTMAAEQGDVRFTKIRRGLWDGVLYALSRKLEQQRCAGKVRDEVHPMAGAAAMGAVLERLSMFHGQLEQFGAERDDVIETSTRLLLQITGSRN